MMIVVAAKESVEAGSRAPHEKGPKVYSTHPSLRQMEGPGFRVILNKNDHRFTATFDKKLPASKHWVGEYKKNSCSRSFNKDSESDWIGKLQDVHEWAWEKTWIGGERCAWFGLRARHGSTNPRVQGA